MKLMKTLMILLVGVTLTTGFGVYAEETVGEKAGATTNKAVNATKRGYRAAKDEVCKMINGKMECVARKVKHKAQNAADSTEAKAKEIKNKID